MEIEITEESNSIDYLEKSFFYINSALVNPFDWKWVVICLHGALYGFMICSLKGTDWHNVVNFYKKGSQVKLISIHEALKRCQNRSWRIRLGDTSYVPFSLTSSQKRSLRLLISEFRNTYVHYIPKHWLIEYTGFPKICYDVLDVIKFFVPIVEQNMFLYYDSDLESLKNDLKKCQDIILNSELYRQSLGK